MSKLSILAVLYLLSLTAFLSRPTPGQAVSKGATGNNETFIGTVSCSRCQELQPHKGYTRWTWAVHSVDEGDCIVLVVKDDTYYLQGDKNQLLKYMEDKVEVTGSLEGRILTVQTIARPVKKTGKRPSAKFPNKVARQTW